MNYVYDTAILSISCPQRGLATTELPTPPPIATPDGGELILSKQFLQWLHADHTTTTLYTSSLRPQERDITILNIAGHQTPVLLLPHGVPPPPPDNPADPLLTRVSLSVRRAPVPVPVPAATPFAPLPSQSQPVPQPAHAPQHAPWAPAAFHASPVPGSHTWGVPPPPPYAYAPPPYPPPPAGAHAHALGPGPGPAAPLTTPGSAAALAQTRRPARQSLPYRAPPSALASFTRLVNRLDEQYMYLTAPRKTYSAEHGIVNARAKGTADALVPFPWALAVAGVGLVLAVVL